MEKRPFRTSFVSVSILYGFADYISQLLFDKNSSTMRWHSPELFRIAKMMIVGGFVYAPINCIIFLKI